MRRTGPALGLFRVQWRSVAPKRSPYIVRDLPAELILNAKRSLTLSLGVVSNNQDILDIFKFTTKEDSEALVYFTFLVMARAVSFPAISRVFYDTDQSVTSAGNRCVAFFASIRAG